MGEAESQVCLKRCSAPPYLRNWQLATRKIYNYEKELHVEANLSIQQIDNTKLIIFHNLCLQVDLFFFLLTLTVLAKRFLNFFIKNSFNAFYS